MFRLFKKKIKFNTPEEKLLDTFQNKIEEGAINNYKKSPMKGTALGRYALLEGLNITHSQLKNESKSYAIKYEIDEKLVLEILKKSYKNVHNKMFKQ